MFTSRALLRLAARWLLALCVLVPCAAFAHPMGNFSVNHYTRVTLRPDAVEIHYLIDMAEIPTYQEIEQAGVATDPKDPATASYLAREADALRRGLRLEVDGRVLPLQVVSRQMIFPPGAGGLPTMKMGFVYRASLPAAQTAVDRLHYADDNFAGRAGWKEIVVRAEGVSLVSSSAPAHDRSAELTNYPTDLLNSPPQDLEVLVTFKPSAAPAVATATHPDGLAAFSGQEQTTSRRARMASSHAAASGAARPKRAQQPSRPNAPPPSDVPRTTAVSSRAEPAASALRLEANKQATPRNAFTELVTARHLGVWFLFTAALIAAGLGALHALEPGHGKTIVAAYLVGSRGTTRHAVLLGLVVTAAHTAGVYALGAVTLFASRYIVPEQLYPWLGMLSGLIIAGMGVFLFLQRWSGAEVEHSHVPGESHGHWLFFSKPRAGESAPKPAGKGQVSLRQLLALGVTGGMIPCPAALVVLLSAFSLHRVGFGFFLIVAFSLGLAAVLITIGVLMVHAGRMLSRLQGDGPLLRRWLPLASSGFMVLLGGFIAVRALAPAGIGLHPLPHDRLAPFLGIVLLGLFLGMRHSTDADHVVAVSTIVSRQRTLRHAAVIGALWGLGHTLTIFLVGAAIILFGVVIPPRIGLSMEFTVALMLILLGALNLTGVLQWMTERTLPMQRALAAAAPQGAPASLRLDGTCPRAGGTGAMGLAERCLERTVGQYGAYQCLRPLAVGIVHGLAGSAAVALLVLSTIHSAAWATAYLLVFGAGTMLGMMLMTTTIAVPFAYAGDRFQRLTRHMGVVSGIVSMAFGLFLAYHIGFVEGLFGSAPQWTPH